MYIHFIKRKFMHFKALSAFGDVLVLQKHPSNPNGATDFDISMFYTFFFFYRYNIFYR